ncbi:2616_t:CDS:1, partial [Racocetra fulgida]
MVVAMRDVPLGITIKQIQTVISQFRKIQDIKQRIVNKWAYITVQYSTEEQAKIAIEE